MSQIIGYLIPEAIRIEVQKVRIICLLFTINWI